MMFSHVSHVFVIVTKLGESQAKHCVVVVAWLQLAQSVMIFPHKSHTCGTLVSRKKVVRQPLQIVAPLTY